MSIKKIAKTYQRQWHDQEFAFDVHHDKRNSTVQQEASYHPVQPSAPPSDEYDPNHNDH